MTFDNDCYTKDIDQQRVLLRVDGEWVFYTGSTSLRKLYYRAYEMVRYNRSKFWVYEYENKKVDAAIFPDSFWNYLSSISMDGVPCDEMPTRLFAKPKTCTKVKLGNGCGRVCTYCGKTDNKGDF